MKKEQIIICPHCGNKTPQEFKSVVNSMEEISDEKGDILGEIKDYYILVQCKTCERVSLFGNWELNDDPFDLEGAKLLYPLEKELSDGVSDIIRQNYAEAKKIKKVSPSGFAVLTRRTLEYVCRDQKAKGKNLKEQLNYLAKKEIIPITLSKMADTLRFLGNIGAHASDFKIDSNEAEIIDDFLTAIIEYVYVAPEKINRVTERLKKKRDITK